MRRSIMKRFVWSGATFVSLVSALLAQGTWTWQQQCSSNEWRTICYIDAECGYDQNGRPVRRYFNNWGLSQCGVSPGLPGPGSVCIFPAGANALLSSNVDILSVGISDGAIFSWQSGSLTLRNPSDNSRGTLSNLGLLRMVGNSSRYLSGVLVNTGTLVHEDGPTYFNGASLQNSGTAEVRGGTWNNNTGTNSFVNTGTLTKTTTNSFTIPVPMQQQGATVNVQAGTLTLSAGSNTHQDVGWSVASGASLRLPSGTHTFVGTHSGAIAGTLVQTGGTVQAGSNGAIFNFTGTGFQWQDGTLNGGSAGLTNAGLLRIVNVYTRDLSGVLVNTGTLVHEAGTTNFNGASLQNSGTAEVRGGTWNNNTGANSLVNTGTLNKTTTSSFTIPVPMQQQGATVNVQAGTLTLSAGSNTHQDVGWSVASGASLRLPSGTHTFVGTHSGAIAGTLVQTGGTVQAGSNGAIFNFTGTGFQWQDGTLNGGSAGLTNAGLLRIVNVYTRDLSGVLVNTGTLVHEAGTTNFNGASLQNSGTAEVRGGTWNNNTGANSLVNTGTLNKTTTSSFTISVPMQQQGATVNVQAGTLTLSAGSNTHQNVSWSVASGATLVLNGTHTFSGTHSGWSVASGATLVLNGTHTFSGTHSAEIAGTLVQTGGTVQAGSNGAIFNFTGTGFQWQDGTLNGGSAGLTNAGLLRIVNVYTRDLSGVLVNTGTLVHEAGTTNFNGASLQNSGTAEVRGGTWNNNTGTNSFVNTGTLNKTTTSSFTIPVPMQQQGATVNVQAGTLTLSAGSNTHQDVGWSVASGASLRLPSGTHTFVGTHSGAIAGTLVQTGGTVQAGSNGAIFNFTGTGFQWQDGTLNGGSAGLTNAGLLRIVNVYTRDLSGVLVNTGTLVHEAGTTNFNGASLQNSGTAEVRGGRWSSNTGTNSFVNTGTLNKTTIGSFTITVNTTNSGLIEVQNGTLSVSNLTQTAGEARIRRGATLSVSNPLAMQGGKLTGAGQLKRRSHQHGGHNRTRHR
jgi:fibronectin-binding autotransporter adhesin